MTPGLSPSQVQSLMARGLMAIRQPRSPYSTHDHYKNTEDRRADYLKLRNARLAQGLTARGTPRKQSYPLTFNPENQTTK